MKRASKAVQTATEAATHWPLITLLCLCGILAGGQFAKVSVEFASLQAHYGASPERIGLLLSTVGVMGLVFGVVAGLLAPRLGYRRLLVWGLAGGGLLSGLQAGLPPLPWLLFSRVPEGATHLAIMVAAPTLLMQVCAQRHHAIVMGLWATVVGVAFALMAGLDRLLPGGLGPQGALAGHGALMLLAAAAVRLWVPDAPASAARPEAVSLLALHRAVYSHLPTALPGLAFLAYAFATIALLTFVPRYSGQGSTAFVTALPLVATVGTLAAGWAARHFHTGLNLARAAYLAFAISALAVGWAAHSGSSTALLALITLTCAGVCGGAAATLIPQLNTTPAAQARASGVLVQLGNLGSVSGPPLFAAVAHRFGFSGLAGLAALCALLALWGLTAAQRKL